VDISCLGFAVSTNDEVKRAIGEGRPEGTAFLALQQSGAYGRQGRSWSSPLGGIYLSLLLRPQDAGKPVGEVPTLGLVLSLAVRRALLEQGSTAPIQVKWPNDVICAEGKLCGISLETVGTAVCVGIGVNLFKPIVKETLDGKYAPAYAIDTIQGNHLPKSVSSKGFSDEQASFFEETVAALVSEVLCLYDRWLVEGFLPFKDEYRACSALQGKTVRLVSQNNGILYEGVVEGIDAQGCLTLLTANGETVSAHSGEAHLV